MAGNLVWYGDFTTYEHKTTTRQGGKGGGGVKQEDVKYTYEAAVMMALCEGVCALSLTACANTPPVKVAAETCPQPLQPPPHLMARQVPKAGSYSENALRNMRDWRKQPTAKPPI